MTVFHLKTIGRGENHLTLPGPRFRLAKGVGKDRGVYSLDAVVKPGIGDGSNCVSQRWDRDFFFTTKLLGKKRYGSRYKLSITQVS